jgi:hypothetical protein
VAKGRRLRRGDRKKAAEGARRLIGGQRAQARQYACASTQQLIRAADKLRTCGRKPTNRELTDVFKVQDEIRHAGRRGAQGQAVAGNSN